MPNDYFVRITYSFEVAKPIISAWALQCDKMVVYEHIGSETEKVHIHVVIMGSRVCKKQLRNIGQTFRPLKGNELCSFKKYDGSDTPIVYMTKGKLDPVYNMGYDATFLEQQKSLWVEPEDRKKGDALEYSLFQTCMEQADKDVSNVDLAGICPRFNLVKARAKHWVYTRNELWRKKEFDLYKTLVYTYCFSHDVVIPKGEWAKWL